MAKKMMVVEGAHSLGFDDEKTLKDLRDATKLDAKTLFEWNGEPILAENEGEIIISQIISTDGRIKTRAPKASAMEKIAAAAKDKEPPKRDSYAAKDDIKSGTDLTGTATDVTVGPKLGTTTATATRDYLMDLAEVDRRALYTRHAFFRGLIVTHPLC